jgi:hypothetical protein
VTSQATQSAEAGSFHSKKKKKNSRWKKLKDKSKSKSTRGLRVFHFHYHSCIHHFIPCRDAKDADPRPALYLPMHYPTVAVRKMPKANETRGERKQAEKGIEKQT